jgi:hypothetical protein
MRAFRASGLTVFSWLPAGNRADASCSGGHNTRRRAPLATSPSCGTFLKDSTLVMLFFDGAILFSEVGSGRPIRLRGAGVGKSGGGPIERLRAPEQHGGLFVSPPPDGLVQRDSLECVS